MPHSKAILFHGESDWLNELDGAMSVGDSIQVSSFILSFSVSDYGSHCEAVVEAEDGDLLFPIIMNGYARAYVVVSLSSEFRLRHFLRKSLDS